MCEDAVDALNSLYNGGGHPFECLNGADLCKHFFAKLRFAILFANVSYKWPFFAAPASGASDDYFTSIGTRFVYAPELR